MSSGFVNKLVYVRKKVFQNDAIIFLDFARLDIREGTTRGLANALTNAKRAIANRVDSLLYAHGMRGAAKRNGWGFPAKIAKLSEIGISTPQVLQNLVNRKRNLLEHDYVIPDSREAVQDIIDVAVLYIDNTGKYIEPGVIQAVLGSTSPSIQSGENLVGMVAPAFGIAFHFDQDRMQLFGALGSGDFIPLSEVGEIACTKVFQTILSAFHGRQVPVTSCETEDVFWSRFF